MELALQALELAEKGLGKTNRNAVSDIGVATVSLRAAAQGAWLNILINTGSIKDARLAQKHRDGGKALLDKTTALADRGYASGLECLNNKPMSEQLRGIIPLNIDE
jgi:formiminotetrahydrofolate cyclodeaminase